VEAARAELPGGLLGHAPAQDPRHEPAEGEARGDHRELQRALGRGRLRGEGLEGSLQGRHDAAGAARCITAAKKPSVSCTCGSNLR